jgi:hypothetical protein
MGRVMAVRVTTANGKDATVRVEYEDGVTRVIIPRDLPIPSRLELAAAKTRVVNQLKGLGADLQNIEPDQIVIEWAAAAQQKEPAGEPALPHKRLPISVPSPRGT